MCSERIKTYIFILILSLFYFSSYTQDKKESENNQQNQNIFEVTEENFQFFIEKKEYSIIYFYSKNIDQSLKMKEIIKNLKIESLGNKYSVLLINLDTNSVLRQTFKVITLPTIVILKNKRFIYGFTGYIDDSNFLSSLITNNIKENDYQQPF